MGQPPAPWPVMSRGRAVLTGFWGAVCGAAGWLLSTGVVKMIGPDVCAPAQACHGGPVTAGYLFGGAFAGFFGLVGTIITTGGDVEGEPRRVPAGVVTLGSVAVGFLGASDTGGRTHPWVLGCAAVAAVLAVPVAARGRRRLGTERAAYAADGTGRTLERTRRYPVFGAPRVGSRIMVCLDPQDPDTAEFVDVLPEAMAPDARPSLAGELERLAGLRREGMLDDGEFERAKALLLAERR